MAFEHLTADPQPYQANSTGLKAKRFGVINTSGKVAYPASGAACDGVLLTSSTGSTTDNQAIKVGTIAGAVYRVQAAAASTVAKGDYIAASSEGRVRALGAGDYCVGKVVDGTSGSSARILSVMFQHIGTT